MKFHYHHFPEIYSVEVSTQEPITQIGKVSRFAHGISESEYEKEGISILHYDVFSVAENITIDIEVLVSERLARQINRHRHMAIVQKSTRYNDYVHEPELDFYIPLGLSQEDEILWKRTIESMPIWNEDMGEASIEEVNYLLPLCSMTKVHYHMNLRTLLHMFQVRLCSQALPEFQHFLSTLRDWIAEQSTQWYYIMNRYGTPKCAQQRTFHCTHPELDCPGQSKWKAFSENPPETILQKSKDYEDLKELESLLLKDSLLK